MLRFARQFLAKLDLTINWSLYPQELKNALPWAWRLARIGRNVRRARSSSCRASRTFRALQLLREKKIRRRDGIVIVLENGLRDFFVGSDQLGFCVRHDAALKQKLADSSVISRLHERFRFQMFSVVRRDRF